MKTLLLIFIATATVTGCGWFDNQLASVTGFSKSCVDGVEYLQFNSGVSVAYTTDGKVKTCSGTYAAYKRYKKNAQEEKIKEVEKRKNLSRFIVWGRPDTGKTTFVRGLRIGKGMGRKKEGTTGANVYEDVMITSLEGGPYKVAKVVDIPGTQDRFSDFLSYVKSFEHAFYLVNLAKLKDAHYIARVRSDITKTIEALKASTSKRLNIIGTHVDESEWKNIQASEVNNVLQEDEIFRALYESTTEVAGYVYVANLTDDTVKPSLYATQLTPLMLKQRPAV
eukprot:gene25165-31592_t